MSHREKAFSAIKNAIAEVLPDLPMENVAIENRLHDLGANSVERAEILMLAMESLEVNVPLVEFADAKNIEGIVGIFESVLSKHA